MELLFKDLYEPSDIRNNRLAGSDRAFHDWYRFVLSFPPHLVRDYLHRFSLSDGAILLDPFCGTGTTLVEAKKASLRAMGIEASPMAAFASRVKTSWGVDGERLRECGDDVAAEAEEQFEHRAGDISDLTDDQRKLLITDSISAAPLRKCLAVRDRIDRVADTDVRDALRLALARTCVATASNLKFGPEVGVRRHKKPDADVFGDFHKTVRLMARDLESIRDTGCRPTRVLCSDSRGLGDGVLGGSIDAVITSPPYPNEKDYTRTTRLESVLLGFIKTRADLKRVKQSLLRSNTRNVYVDDADDGLITVGSHVDRIAREIEDKRRAMGKTSGFEKLYHRVTRLYFGGMKRHLMDLQRCLKPGALLAYVVGDQASYLQVMIRTGQLLAGIAEEAGYRVVGIDLFRTRVSTVTGEQLREEVLVLQWKG